MVLIHARSPVNSQWPMEELRNTLQTNCWEAGGCQLPSYITTLTVSSADREGGKWLQARKTSIERRKNRKRSLKNRSNFEGKEGEEKNEGDVRGRL